MADILIHLQQMAENLQALNATLTGSSNCCALGR